VVDREQVLIDHVRISDQSDDQPHHRKAATNDPLVALIRQGCKFNNAGLSQYVRVFEHICAAWLDEASGNVGSLDCGIHDRLYVVDLPSILYEQAGVEKTEEGL
jgi:hypothetical protein